MTNIQFDLDCTGREFVRKFICVISLMGIVLFSGCSTSTQFGSIASDIELASRSTSPFDETIFSGEIIQHNTNMENLPEYRIFHKGASGFVSRTSVRNSALKRIKAFCSDKEATPIIITERRSSSALIPGNFPRAEFIFICKKNPPKKTISDAYENLLQLKKLLDAGVITQEEFNNEKRKVFSVP